jgi:hypothetical protein
VIGHKDAGPVCRQIIFILYTEAGAEKIKAAQQEEIEDVNALFVGLIASQVKTQPLYGVENQQVDKKEDVKYYRKRVRKDLFEGFHFYLLAKGCNFCI